MGTRKDNLTSFRRLKFKYIKKRKRQRLSYKTIKKDEQYLGYIENAVGHISLRDFNDDTFDIFFEQLDQLTYRGKKLSDVTKIGTLNCGKQFFTFVKEQPGFKTAYPDSFIDNFNLSYSEKQTLKNVGKKIKPCPSKDEVLKIISIMPNDTVLERRNRVLLEFSFLSAARIQAGITIPLSQFDTDTRIVDQDPSKGVETKFKKHIITTIPKWDDNLFDEIVSWKNELTTYGFGLNDALFPSAKPIKKNGFIEFTQSEELTKEGISYSTAGRIIKDACTKAGYPQYHAHSFRDAHIKYGLPLIKNALELKAFSLNLGHDNVDTTLRCYADLVPDDVHKIMLKIVPVEETITGIPNDVLNTVKDVWKAIDPESYNRHFSSFNNQK